ncbi:MAG: orotidine-5'-phosphate decarboxylase [Leptonema sp. (in: bacteria)]
MSTFNLRLKQIILQKKHNICIGMDPDPNRLPKGYVKNPYGIYDFLKDVIQYTYTYTIAYKFNLAFYFSLGPPGIEILNQILKELYDKSSTDKKILIADAKIGDIENTAKHYAYAYFEIWNFDAITLNPFMGFDAIKPFLEYSNKGCFILCLTSNPSNKDFEFYGDPPLFKKIAKKIYEWNQINDNLMAVVGATNQKSQLLEIKNILQDIPVLVPGVGAQGGDFRTIKEIFGKLALINIGRGILYSSQERDLLKIRIQEYLEQMEQ